jgi:UDP-N-acetylglucosamine--N-acetylmuramyl-(pentapeptide) pyrophosphoryl-undecaprenol N-acetylglucosamine transferase
MHSDTILLVGGGTGGHVFPLIAVADELKRLAPGVRLVFVGTERGLENQAVPAAGYELSLIQVEPIRGRGLWGGLKGVGNAARSLPAAFALLDRYRPRVVFSIGGYAAGPLSAAARLKSIPLALMEPNSVAGLANRLIAPWVQRAYTCFWEVERHFPTGRVLRTGVAIRRGFEAAEYRLAAGGSEGPLRILVLGGSQGAQSLNDTVPRALSVCSADFSVVHQAGKGRDGAVRALYDELGASRANVEVVPFIDDVPRALAQADLVIGRSGAGVVAEICAVGRPALFIPYPYASGDHQFHNAQSLVRQGAAVCVRHSEAGTVRLAHELSQLAANPERLVQMARAAQILGKPEAAETVALDLLELGKFTAGASADDTGERAATRARAALSSEVH